MRALIIACLSEMGYRVLGAHLPLTGPDRNGVASIDLAGGSHLSARKDVREKQLLLFGHAARDLDRFAVSFATEFCRDRSHHEERVRDEMVIRQTEDFRDGYAFQIVAH
jgi:hypothetical protein